MPGVRRVVLYALGRHRPAPSRFQRELEIKQLQIAHAPDQRLLFLNIDQDAFETFLDEPRHPLVELLAEHPRAVVELIENSSVSDARVSIAMLRQFGGAGIPMALDDIGAGRRLKHRQAAGRTRADAACAGG